MNFFSARAHVDEEGRYQLLIDHLKNTAELAATFASHFNAYDNGYVAGLYHDIGKCTEAFGKRLEGGPMVDHSTAGAYFLCKKKRLLESIAVASHHTGLQDMGSGDKYEVGTFSARIRNYKNENEIADFLEWLDGFAPEGDLLNNYEYEALQFFITEHFLFSSLVDADYTDTGRFLGSIPDKMFYDFNLVCKRILDKADMYLNAKSDKCINILRNKMLQKCLDKASSKQGLYSLTMPTGSGKTFSSLAFAAKHASFHSNIRRIIYVIPYLSIIEQNAAVIRDIVGAENVLEHHSVSPVFSDGESIGNTTLQLAAENWDIPIVVTTNEQFFESMFSAKPSRCRKIHNIADSIIIFDEAQMLPLKYLQLFSALLEELVYNDRYGITAVLCTATQPSLDVFMKHEAPIEIVDETLSCDPVFKRNHVKDIRDKKFSDVCDMASSYQQALVIVNRKKDARTVYDAFPSEGRYYLTTNLTPHSRRRILAEIKNRLSLGLICHVVSTSLIEAGVDVDFPIVFREKSGLDSVIQAAGRCNREGRYSALQSIVYVFNSGNTPNYADYSRKVWACDSTFNSFSDVFSVEAVRRYYDLYYHLSQTQEAMELFKTRLPFKKIGDEIRIIDKTDAGIFIRQNDDAEEIFESICKGGVTRNILRRATEYTVRCPKDVVQSLINSGEVTKITDDFTLLINNLNYNEDTGYDYCSLDGSDALFF